MKKIEAISLFSGAMGLDLGLEAAGIEIKGCVENNPPAVETIRLNRPSLPVICDDISNLTAKDICDRFKVRRGLDLVVGGPPCQAFSVIGRRRGLNDKNGKLVFEFIRIVTELNPKAFLMENVRGLLSMPMKKGGQKGSLFKEILERFNTLGYRADVFLVNAVNYGAPQIRERVFLIGNRLDRKASFPQPTHSDKPAPGQHKFVTLGEALKKLKGADSDIMDFSPRKKKYLSLVPPGGNWRSLPVEIQKESMGKTWYLKGGRSAYWRRLSFDYPSPTVVTMPNHAGTSMCHPVETRALSVGECAAIQTFPIDWKFYGNATEKCRQIGNAVPVILGEMAGEAIKRLFIDRVKRLPSMNGHTIEHIRPHVRTRQYFKSGEVFTSSPYKNIQDQRTHQRALQDA